jgi:hypothetical protein
MVVWECQISQSHEDRLQARIVAFLDNHAEGPSRKITW